MGQKVFKSELYLNALREAPASTKKARMQEVAELVAVVLGPGNVQTVTYQQLVGDLSDRGSVRRSELDLRFAEACERLQPGRFFVVDYPADQAALARLRPDNPSVAARFELVIDGIDVFRTVEDIFFNAL